ncbi:MAG: hypothetical protein ACI4U4_04445 [Bacilli bacterium]
MKDLIRIENDTAILENKMVQDLITVEQRIKELKKIQDTYKETIRKAMEEKNLIKLVDETTGLTISYIAAQNNLEKFNKDKFQEENPDLYDKYVTMDGKKSAYITVRIK